MERRNSLEICAEILRIARVGAKKTHIVYKANLNHVLLETYLDKLEAQGLIVRNAIPRTEVKTTEKGLQFVEQYRSLQTLVSF